jgi:cation diffusion facilitator family transporter
MEKGIHNSGGDSRTVLVGLVANILLACIKLISGILGHSYALVADSVESLVDVLGSIVVFGGIKIAEKDSNDQFPYGLGKAEGLAAFVVGLIVILASIGIAVEAISEILRPHQAPEPWTLIVLIGVIVTKEILHLLARRASRKSGSLAMSADAFHHRADSLTSMAAAIGISVAIFGGPEWAAADDWAALFASAIILYNGISIARSASLHLLDTSADLETIESIRAAAHGVDGVIEIEKLLVRASGTKLFVDIHVHADPEMTLAAAHRLGGIVKSAIQSSRSDVSGVLVHMEPAGEE